MSKERIIDSLAQFKTACSTYIDKAKTIDGSGAYTPEGKKQALEKLAADNRVSLKSAGNRVLSEMDSVLEKLSVNRRNAIRKNLTDAGSAAGLQNAVNAIIIGAVTTPEDMKVLVDVYKADPLAMQILRNAATSADCKTDPAIRSALYEQNSDFETLKKCRDKMSAMTVNAVSGNLSEWSLMNIDGYTTVINDMTDLI
ncbi:MAG: hypothetical protein IIZ73_04825 [Ruminococcus sp.]|nr:hypothetical protein [Ruminococcus sp.]